MGNTLAIGSVGNNNGGSAFQRSWAANGARKIYSWSTYSWVWSKRKVSTEANTEKLNLA